jgi:hypothetical protein
MASLRVVDPVRLSKLEKIRYLLDHWEDIFSPPGVTSTSRSSEGGGVALLPLMSRDRSVVELERCLRVLAVEAPCQLSHLKAYRCAEWRVRVDRVRRKRRSASGKPLFETVTVRTRERVVPRWVRLEKVRRAEARLVQLFRGSVRVPDELWDALVLSAEQVAEKERLAERGAA